MVAYSPMLVLLGLYFVVPESTRWLLAKGRIDEAKEKASKTRNILAQREYQQPTSGKCENKTCADGNPPLQNAWERDLGLCGQCVEDEGLSTSHEDYKRDKVFRSLSIS